MLENESSQGGLRVFWLKLGPVSVPVPHPGELFWHDLHHLILGYDTMEALIPRGA